MIADVGQTSMHSRQVPHPASRIPPSSRRTRRDAQLSGGTTVGLRRNGRPYSIPAEPVNQLGSPRREPCVRESMLHAAQAERVLPSEQG